MQLELKTQPWRLDMKVALILVAATLVLPIPAQGTGNVHHHGRHYMIHTQLHSRIRPTKWDFLYKEHSDLRAEKGVALQGQNKVADDSGIRRALTQEDYDEKIANGELVKFPKKIDCVVVDSRLNLKPFLEVSAPEVIDYITTQLAPAFCRNEAGDFVQKPLLVISSLTRTLVYQRILARRNAAARSALGDDDPNRRSSHSTGFTFDISMKNLDPKAATLLADFLDKEKQPGGNLAAAYLEAHGDHFHVMVCPSFPLAPCVTKPPIAERMGDEEDEVFH
jgi:hypothetical protein